MLVRRCARPLSKAVQRSTVSTRHWYPSQHLVLSSVASQPTTYRSTCPFKDTNVPLHVPLCRQFSSTQTIKWPSEIAKRIHRRMRHFPRNSQAKELIMEAGMNAAEWAMASSSFRQSFLKEPFQYFENQAELEAFGRVLDDKTRHSSFIFYPYFVDYAKAQNYVPTDPEKTKALSLQQLTDLRLPHQMYPFATAMKRKIIYHAGPTNSGKTYQALARLKQAGPHGGIYCGPLRLLALEIYERLNADGLYTSLVTGQEKKIVPYATHISCTVEMAQINQTWDVAVLDEIQLIGDLQRGWAWTRAFFGLQAHEIHVCGSSEAVELIQKFAATTGDEFEVRTYTRRSPLIVASSHLPSYSSVRHGDCVVAFSRREIFRIKREIEVQTGQKCCIIYGQLPPETRSHQAQLFNARTNDYNILVASDAVGMGLNLNIRRVVFSTVQKYSGPHGGMVDIPSALVKQIAGRAGRFTSDYDAGEVTCLSETDLRYVQDSYDHVPSNLTSAGLFPTSDQMVEFAKQLPMITDLADLVDKYVMLARLDGAYFMCNSHDMKDAASVLRDTNLTLSDRFTFCMSPVGLRNPLARRVFLEYARAHSLQQRVKLDIYLPKVAPRTAEALGEIEIKAKIIDLYLWLSFRFAKTFVENRLALELKARVLELVEEGLVNTTYHREERKTRWASGVENGRNTRWQQDQKGGWKQQMGRKRQETTTASDEGGAMGTRMKTWFARVFGKEGQV